MTLYPSAFMVHSCAVIHATGAYSMDDYGNQIPVTSSTTTKCRFSQNKEQVSDGTSIYLKSIPKIAIPPEVSIAEEDKITSIVTGYTGTYNVKSLKAVYYPTTETVSHYSCELVAVV